MLALFCAVNGCRAGLELTLGAETTVDGPLWLVFEAVVEPAKISSSLPQLVSYESKMKLSIVKAQIPFAQAKTMAKYEAFE